MSSCGKEFSSDTDDNLASESHHTGLAMHGILCGNVVMSVPESHRLRSDVMRHIDVRASPHLCING